MLQPCGIRLPSPAPWLAWTCGAAGRQAESGDKWRARARSKIRGCTTCPRAATEWTTDPSTRLRTTEYIVCTVVTAGCFVRCHGGGARTGAGTGLVWGGWGFAGGFQAVVALGRPLHDATQTQVEFPLLCWICCMCRSHASPTMGWATFLDQVHRVGSLQPGTRARVRPTCCCWGSIRAFRSR